MAVADAAVVAVDDVSVAVDLGQSFAGVSRWIQSAGKKGQV